MRIAFISFLFLLLSGCAHVKTSVSAFHEMQQPLNGATYVITPTKDQENSLEFQSYANLVKIELNKKGMIESQASVARYVFFMYYGIDGGRQVISSTPMFGQTGIGSSTTRGTITSYGNTATYNGKTYNNPTYGIVGSDIESSTEFTRYLYIEIVDTMKSLNGKVQKVYEGKAISSGSSSQLAPVMPAIIKSMFEDFPGTSGATRKSRQSY